MATKATVGVTDASVEIAPLLNTVCYVFDDRTSFLTQCTVNTITCQSALHSKLQTYHAS